MLDFRENPTFAAFPAALYSVFSLCALFHGSHTFMRANSLFPRMPFGILRAKAKSVVFTFASDLLKLRGAPFLHKPYVCGCLGALWQKRRFATRFELLYPSRESRKRDAAIRLIFRENPTFTAFPAALSRKIVMVRFLIRESSSQGPDPARGALRAV